MIDYDESFVCFKPLCGLIKVDGKALDPNFGSSYLIEVRKIL